VEKFLFGKSYKASVRQIGLLKPKMAGIGRAIAIGVLLLLTIPIFGWAKNVSFSFYPQWYLLLPGLFFQAGIAEETLFRGYLFGHLRNRHGFWQAAVFAAIPFVIVHLFLFYSMPWPIATASILLSIAMSFPLSRLFEMSGNTIWAPAIVHFVIQGSVKVVIASGESAWAFPLFWIAVSALVPLIVLCYPAGLERSAKTDR
jgi:membrane protease YdiL (CAAX protease family)